MLFVVIVVAVFAFVLFLVYCCVFAWGGSRSRRAVAPGAPGELHSTLEGRGKIAALVVAVVRNRGDSGVDRRGPYSGHDRRGEEVSGS